MGGKETVSSRTPHALDNGSLPSSHNEDNKQEQERHSRRSNNSLPSRNHRVLVVVSSILIQIMNDKIVCQARPLVTMYPLLSLLDDRLI